MNLSTGTRSTPSLLSGNWLRFYEAHLTALSWPGILVPWLLSSFTFGVVQVRASQAGLKMAAQQHTCHSSLTSTYFRTRRTPRGACPGGAKREES